LMRRAICSTADTWEKSKLLAELFGPGQSCRL
jgi:hypothetical protein